MFDLLLMMVMYRLVDSRALRRNLCEQFCVDLAVLDVAAEVVRSSVRTSLWGWSNSFLPSYYIKWRLRFEVVESLDIVDPSEFWDSWDGWHGWDSSYGWDGWHGSECWFKFFTLATITFSSFLLCWTVWFLNDTGTKHGECLQTSQYLLHSSDCGTLKQETD